MEINEDNIDIFKSEVKQVVHINSLIIEVRKMIKPLQDKLKRLRLEKKEMEKKLCPTMEKNDLRKTILPGDSGFIEYKIKHAIVPITQKTVKEKMDLFFKSGPGSHISFNSNKPDDKAAILFDYIYGKENREYIKKEELIVKS